VRPNRTSGEIVNATLLEVFLTLSFLAMGLAVFAQARASRAEARAGRAQAHSTILRRALAKDSAKFDSLRGTQSALGSIIDSLKAKSRLRPECDPDVPGDLITVKFDAGTRLVVTVNRAIFGLRKGEMFDIAEATFGSRFSEVSAFSLANRCLFSAFVVDSPLRSKDESKRGGRVIAAVFRLHNFLQ